MIQTQFQTKIQVLKTDNAREYFDTILGDYLASQGIVHKSSCVNTPQQNGVAERKNRHLLEVARSLMFATHVPKHFWGEAVLTVAYLINRMPSRVLNFQTPYQVLLQSYPTTRVLSTIPFKIFGCSAFVHIHSQHRSKLDPKAIKCIFIGYSSNQKGYKCYYPVTRKFYHSMDVSFFEQQPYYPKSDIQGENFTHEYQLWDIETLETSFSNHSPMSSIEIPQYEIPLSEPQTEPQPSQQTIPTHSVDASELRVYTRRNKTQERRDLQSPEHNHESDPTIESHESSLGNPESAPIEVPNNDLHLPIALRKGVRSCTSHPICNFVSYNGLSLGYHTFVSNLDKVQVPNSIHEALAIPEWKAAVLEEIRALEQNETWEISDLPTGKYPVGCKWIFTVKHNADGSVNRFKARLVAKGFTQSYGVDYQETFAPVAKLNTVRILLSLASNLDWPLYRLDVKNAFLNGDLEEEVYMEIPPGFATQTTINKVCKLRKSLYGLKQSPRAWFDRFTKAIKGFGYNQCQADHTMFIKQSFAGRKAILIVYVDDIILTGDHEEETLKLKEFLAKEFEIKDLGSLKYFLGMEVARSKKGISVSQRKYVLDLLKETRMLGCKPIDTPMDPTIKLRAMDDNAPVDKGRYQRLVGKLIYLSHTRPDISFPVSVVSQFMNNPTEEHMEAVFRILRYLKMTPGKGLFFKKTTSRKIEIFTDADWAGSVIDRRSTSGYCTYVWGNLVRWRSKKQSVVSRSSAEAEFRALAHGICEGIWLRRVLQELSIPVIEPMKMYCDNQSAISIAKNPVHHDRTKHVEIDRHFVKEKIESGIISLLYTSTCQQIADIFTKAVPRKSFEELNSKLGLINIYGPA
ncbi:Retrovirus-related Pol polyprotein from transposon TNT 1-94 [Melia azedarach]|uniref:Retrovirus-related Pol polyprotein from transposon TNT 1-94 n=1 Tax=Melia azedarach TaxID=155640 RepID=A0ACC1WWM5_MELAZ|nr:Retrovirus-related Pol polyprotein from transposon TNT 1-94 [Melia azedarach]